MSDPSVEADRTFEQALDERFEQALDERIEAKVAGVVRRHTGNPIARALGGLVALSALALGCVIVVLAEIGVILSEIRWIQGLLR